MTEIEPIAWDKRSGEWVAHVGQVIFHYHPDTRRMLWRGKTYHGVAVQDIDAFVRNRAPQP